MLKLTKRDETPIWLDIVPGVRMQFRPVTVPMIAAAKRAARNAYIALPEESTDDDREAAANVAMMNSVVRAGLISWEGVGDADGQPIDVSPEAIGLIMDQWPVFESIMRQYLAPAFDVPGEAVAA